MRIKNVSSTDIPLPEFQLLLKPGDIGDLSPFDPKVIYTHKLLSAYFEKGLLVNLGNATPPGSRVALRSARDRIANLKIGDYISKPANKKAPNRSQIDATIRRNESRVKPSAGDFDTNKERYSDEYFQNMNPGATREDSSQPKPKVKIKDSFSGVQIQPDGTITFGSHGRIETAVLTGPTTFLSTPTPPPQNTVTLTDKLGGQVVLSLDAIQERLNKKCLGFTNSGKPCKKLAVTGFQSCLTHFSRTEKKEYEQLKVSSSQT